MKDFVRRTRKSYRWEWAWAIEQNPKETGYHIHGLQHGEYIPQRRLETLWGGRRVWIEEATKDPGWYMTKACDVVDYFTDNTEGHLEMNGGRSVHMTRGYLHGATARVVQQLWSRATDYDEFGEVMGFHLETPTAEELGELGLTNTGERVR